MAEKTLDNLNDIQFDVLKEIGNIGAGNATTALAKMMNMKIDMNVPRVELVPFTNLPDIFGSPEEVLAGILVQLDGDIKGMMMFLVKEESAHNLVNSLMGGMVPEGAGSFSDMELSARLAILLLVHIFQQCLILLTLRLLHLFHTYR